MGKLTRNPGKEALVMHGAGLGICVLGSGSGGNSSVVRTTQGRTMLLDLGFGPRTTGKRLEQAKVNLQEVEAVCLTHLDQDHFRPAWMGKLLEEQIPLFLHRWHLPEFERLPGAVAMRESGLLRLFEKDVFEPVTGVRARPIRLPHDLKGTVGFVLEAQGARLGYATDLGHVPEELVEEFTGVDVLALESNYEPELELASRRPAFLKKRIMGGHGHLSNQQAFEAVRKIASRSPGGRPQKVMLLHRSSQCNHPTRVLKVFSQDAEILRRVILTEQRRRSRWVTARANGAGEPGVGQMELPYQTAEA
ncbi:MAG: MBL fold metallo-hydrolase [Phycisphaeraceae bacterium]|nr:MBL fold metallo-hydrolase [Phycisphaeraceae bacterium]